MVPTFTMYRLTGEVPSFAPAASPHLRRRPSPWPPHRHSEPASESTTHTCWSCTADRPISTRLEPACRLRSFPHWFKLRLHLPVSLAGPGPSGGADPSRRCRGCSHPHLRPQARAAPSFKGLPRQANGGVLSPPPGTWRLVAHPNNGTERRRRSRTRRARSACTSRHPVGGGAGIPCCRVPAPLPRGHRVRILRACWREGHLSPGRSGVVSVWHRWCWRSRWGRLQRFRCR